MAEGHKNFKSVYLEILFLRTFIVVLKILVAIPLSNVRNANIFQTIFT